MSAMRDWARRDAHSWGPVRTKPGLGRSGPLRDPSRGWVRCRRRPELGRQRFRRRPRQSPGGTAGHGGRVAGRRRVGRDRRPGRGRRAISGLRVHRLGDRGRHGGLHLAGQLLSQPGHRGDGSRRRRGRRPRSRASGRGRRLDRRPAATDRYCRDRARAGRRRARFATRERRRDRPREPGAVARGRGFSRLLLHRDGPEHVSRGRDLVAGRDQPADRVRPGRGSDGRAPQDQGHGSVPARSSCSSGWRTCWAAPSSSRRTPMAR